MAEVVDAIIAELIARDNGYTATLEKAIAVHERFSSSVPKKSATGQAFSTAEIDRYTNRHKQASGEIASASEQSSDRVKRAKKSETDTSIAEDGRGAASAERAAKTRADVEIAEAERSARSRARINSATYGPPRPINIIEPGTGRPQTFGFGNPTQSVSDRPLPVGRATTTGAASAETEINRALADQIGLQGRLTAARGEDRQIIQDEIFQIQQMNRYIGAGLSELEATAKVEADLLAIEELRTRNAQVKAAADAAALEKQIAAQSAQVSKGVSLFAGALVGGITVAELSHLNDEYIKFSNSLKVAGVSALDFDSVQQHLLQTSVRTGTSIGALSDTYRSIALASHDLGASQADILKVTDAVANSLRITGASGGAARAAILQLGHAFETGRVTAREFNGLALNAYPVLQAAAAGSDKYAGSVSKLRQALLDGDLSSKEFFANILAGSDQLKDRAAKAGLTTAQGFTALNNALIVYFGTADKAQGVSAAFGAALEKLAENLNIVIPAIAAIGVALTVGFIARAGAAAVAAEGLGVAILRAFGGPVGLAVTAITLAVADFAVANNDANASLQKSAEGLKEVEEKYGKVGNASHGAAAGLRNVGDDALAQVTKINGFSGAVAGLTGNLLRQAAAARVARLELLDKQADEARDNQRKALAKTGFGQEQTASEARAAFGRGNLLEGFGKAFSNGKARFYNFLSGGEEDQKAQAEADNYGKQAGAIGAERNRVSRLKLGDASDFAGDGGGKVDGKTGGGGSGRSGPSADTLARRAEAERLKGIRDDRQFDAALRQAQSEQLSAQADITNDAGERAKIERDRVQASAQQLAKEIASKGPGGTKEFTDAEVFQLQYLNASVANLRTAAIDQAERKRKADDARNLDQASAEVQRSLLQSQSQLADTLADRKRIALELLDLDYQQREKELRATLSPDSGASPGDRAVAQRRLDALPDQKAGEEREASRQFEGVGASYRRSLNIDRPQFVQSEEVKLLEGFNAELDDSVKKALHLHGIFGDIIGDLIDMAIKQALIKPLAGALFGGGGESGGGGLGGIFGSIAGLFGGGGSSAAASAAAFSLPGFANGGSGTIGGNTGIDRNVLSINGSPVAKVGRGETLSVSPNVAASNQRANAPSVREGDRNFNISVNAENSVTPAGFAQGLAQQILAEAGRMDQQTGRGAVRVSSANTVSRQVLGTERT